MSVFIFLAILIPLIIGLVIHFIKNNKKLITILVSVFSSLTLICVILLSIFSNQRIELFKLTKAFL